MTDSGDNLQTRDLLRVLEVSRTMAATIELEPLLRLVVERSMELLQAERASVFLYDPQRHELATRVAEGVREIRISADRGIVGATIRSGQTIHVPDAYADDRFDPDVDRRTGFRTRNIISAPMRGHDGSLVGVLQVINRRRGGFSPGHITLAETFSAQAGVALQRANLLEHYRQKLMMERAMTLARDIQQGLLPRDNPEVPGFDVAGFSDPADETGGDAYDFFRLPDGRWMIVLADATGHGIGPALVVSETRAMLRAVSLSDLRINSILDTVNDLLYRDLDEMRFVTCFYALLDARHGRIRYTSAGHGPILYYDREADRVEEARAAGLPLGIMPDSLYDEVCERGMQPGDFLVVTSDGITEAARPDGEMFGVGRLKEFLRDRCDATAVEMIEELKRTVAAFVAGGEQADDLTAVVIRRA